MFVNEDEAQLWGDALFKRFWHAGCHVEFHNIDWRSDIGAAGNYQQNASNAFEIASVIAADLNPARRKLALELGADYALDPAEEGFADKVRELTKERGVNACVEVTGASKAMSQALDCASWMGRIALLGCTRVSDCAVDYYQKVHRPGVKLIGAHNFVRPKFESYPHHWTHHDDCRAILDLIAAKKLRVRPIVSRVVAPGEAPEIYRQLCDDPAFPIGTVFDWREQ